MIGSARFARFEIWSDLEVWPSLGAQLGAEICLGVADLPGARPDAEAGPGFADWLEAQLGAEACLDVAGWPGAQLDAAVWLALADRPDHLCPDRPGDPPSCRTRCRGLAGRERHWEVPTG